MTIVVLSALWVNDPLYMYYQLSLLFYMYRPFDTVTYEDEIDDDDILDEEGRTRTKLKVCENKFKVQFTV